MSDAYSKLDYVSDPEGNLWINRNDLVAILMASLDAEVKDLAKFIASLVEEDEQSDN